MVEFLYFLGIVGIVILTVYIFERCTDEKKEQNKTNTQNNSSRQNQFVESEFDYIKNKELRTNLEKAKFVRL